MIGDVAAAWFLVLVAGFAPLLAAAASARRPARRATLPVRADGLRRRRRS